MKAVAEALGAKVCRELTMKQIVDNIPMLREKVNDRAVLRAMHFINEDHRVTRQVAALEEDNFEEFLSLIKESGTAPGSGFRTAIPPTVHWNRA